METTENRAKAVEVIVGDLVRTDRGEVIRVTRIEERFFGNDDTIALIEDPSERWYKRPLRRDVDIEILERAE